MATNGTAAFEARDGPGNVVASLIADRVRIGGLSAVEIRLKSLMIAGQAGDGAAYGELLSALSGYLRGYFSRRLAGRPADVEDLVQETLLAIHLKRDSYDPSQPFTPWAYAMARYKLLDHFRRTGARKTVPMEEAGVLFAVETVENGAIRTDLSRLLGRLPDRQRHLVSDVKLEGLSLKEAAEKGGYSLTAAKVSLHRALKALSRAVADEDD